MAVSWGIMGWLYFDDPIILLSNTVPSQGEHVCQPSLHHFEDLEMIKITTNNKNNNNNRSRIEN